jgi:putative restriction endonuclease
VNLYLYPTDLEWFEFLRSQPGIDEVNFWQPGGRHAFSRLQVGELFLFRLKSPVNMIGGGGHFLHSSVFPLNAAWEAFGEKNGTSDPVHFTRMIANYKRVSPWEAIPADSPIGCIILAEPFFWPEEKWIQIPADYHLNLVQGKRYDATNAAGRALFDAVTERLQDRSNAQQHHFYQPPEMGWRKRLVNQRVGQGAFRVLVTDLYDRRCAITGERTLPVLEAAHIKPVARGGSHNPTNGLLLRSDIHKLFDLGYVTVQPNGDFRVSSRLRDEWSNGKIYYALENTSLRKPRDEDYMPAKEALEWHNDTVFRG